MMGRGLMALERGSDGLKTAFGEIRMGSQTAPLFLYPNGTIFRGGYSGGYSKWIFIFTKLDIHI